MGSIALSDPNSVKVNPMSETFHYQTVTQEAYDSAFKLQTQCHEFPWSRGQFFDCLTPPYFSYQLVKDGVVVGYYVGLSVSVEVTLMDIGIAKEARGQGLGEALLKHFLRECNQRQAEEAWLEVRVSNTSAISLYSKMGFEEIERRKNYYPAKDGSEDAIIMRLTLGR